MSAKRNKDIFDFKKIWPGVSVVGAAALLGFAVSRFNISGPTNYLVRTGFGIKDLQVGRSFVRWPFQCITRVSLVPTTHNWRFQCLSAQYLPFELPVTCTTAPIALTTDEGGAKRYAASMSTLSDEERNVIIEGIIHGDFRVLAAQCDIDALNDDREEFRLKVVKKVEESLSPLGVMILNANIAEIQEQKRAGMGYLEARERKKLSAAIYQSEIDVAEAKKRGDIETMERRAQARMKTAEMEARATLEENEQRKKIASSNASLAVAQAEAKRQETIAKIEADQASFLREQQLQKDVEQAKQERELIKARAEELTKTQVKAEEVRVRAEAQLFEDTKKADGHLITQERKAQGLYAEFKARADGTLANLLAEAKGKRENLDAEAGGISNLVQGLQDPELVKLHFLLRQNVPEQLAKANAEALRGLQPKIWTFHSDTSKNDNLASSIMHNFLKGLPASLEMLQDYGLLKKSHSTQDKEPMQQKIE